MSVLMHTPTSAAMFLLVRVLEALRRRVRSVPKCIGALSEGSSVTWVGLDGAGVSCERGCIWLTQDGDPRDVVLAGGQAHRVDRRGRVIVTALADSEIALTVSPG
jgi:hypothetical protein